MASNGRRTRRVRIVRRLTVAAATCAVVAGAGYPTVHLYDRHQKYGVWTWSPSGATPKLPFQGRTYLSSATATTTMTIGLTRIGTTPDGEIFGPPTGTPTTIVLRLHNGTTTQYSLSGGP